MHTARGLIRIPLLALVALLATTAAAGAAAIAPTAPPQVVSAPAGTVNEKTAITFRIKAAASDQQVGRWAVLIDGGNDEVLELKPTASDPTVYERTIRLHNDKVYAGEREDGTADFTAPRVSSRMFPGTVTWSAAFFPSAKPSATGDRRTRTPKQKFELKPTFEERHHVARPSLPRAKSHRIVPKQSIAGIALGYSRSQVLKRWGTPFTSDESLFDRSDIWSRGSVANGKVNMTGDTALVEYDQGTVDLIELDRSKTSPGALSKLKTSKGIGLGSSRRALLKAYPNIEPVDDEEDPGESFTLSGKSNETLFGLDRHHRINEVLMRGAG